jgi:hypothetical protein
MRQIDAVLSFMVFLVTGKKTLLSLEDFAEKASQGNEFHLQLDELVKQGKICEAENMLFNAIDQEDRSVLESAILFYANVNKLSDDDLEECEFSRDEVREGLRDVCSAYGIWCDLF